MAMVVVLPWPHPDLSPNARTHWAPLAHQKKTARIVAKYIAYEAGARKLHLVDTAVISITFNPPDRRGRDLDNCIASNKAANDGIADAIGVDDARWRVTYAMGVPVKGGRVVVRVSA